MSTRGSRFWRGPGLLLGCFGLIAVGAILAFLAVVGPPIVDGLILVLIGIAVIWARSGFGDYAYAKAQYGYIWPRDPEKMKPNAELEGGFMTVVAVIAGIGLIIGGLAMMSSGG